MADTNANLPDASATSEKPDLVKFSGTLSDGTFVSGMAPRGTTPQQIEDAYKTRKPAQSGAGSPGAASPTPATKPFNLKERLGALAAQFGSGAQEGSMLLGAAGTGARAATGAQTIAPEPATRSFTVLDNGQQGPQSVGDLLKLTSPAYWAYRYASANPEMAARHAGQAAGVATDLATGTEALRAFPAAKALLQAAHDAAPIRTALGLNAAAGATRSATDQYSETGQVNTGRTVEDAVLGGVLGGIIPASASAINALPTPAKKALMRLVPEAKSPEEAAKTLRVQAADQLGTEVNPSARAAGAEALNSPKGYAAIADVGAARAQSALDKLSAPATSVEDVARLASRTVNRDIYAAETAAQNAEQNASIAQGQVGTASSPKDLGLQVNQALKKKLAALDAERKEKSAPKFDEAENAMKGKVPELSSIRAKLMDPEIPGLSGEQASQLKSVYQKLEQAVSDVSPKTRRPTLTSLLTGTAGTKEAAPEINLYKKMRQYATTLGHMANGAANEGDKGRAMKAAAVDAKNAIEAELHRLTTPEGADRSLHDVAKAEYQKHSVPINEIVGTGVAPDVIEHQPFLDRFLEKPEDTIGKFVSQKSNGAASLKAGLGQEAEPALRAHFSHEIQDMNGDQVKALVDKHQSFLNEFPALRDDLARVANEKSLAESIRKRAAEDITSGKAFDATYSHVDVAEEALYGAIQNGKRADLDAVVSAVRREAPQTANTLLRNVVAKYYADKLTPVLTSATTKVDVQARNEIASGISSTIKDWEKRKKLLQSVGMLTPEHANNVDAVMKNLSSFLDSISHLPPSSTIGKEEIGEKLGKHAIEALAWHTGINTYGLGAGSIAKGTAIKGFNIIEDRAKKMVIDAITSPDKAAALAAYRPYKPTLDDTLSKLLLYPAIPSRGDSYANQQTDNRQR